MNKEERRNHFAAIALAQLLIPENFSGVLDGAAAKKMDLGKAMALACVDLADALIAELDRTNPKTETPQPDADGWIPHKPGDPMPCDPALMVSVKHGDGIVTDGCTAVFWGSHHDKDTDWWTGKDCLEENLIVAWKPA